MPVTAKLSKKFYEKLGEDVANELVDWFNMVDATYRSELRELNELNFARFDAKLEQRVAELKADLKAEFNNRIAELRTETARLIAEVNHRVAELRSEMQVGFKNADVKAGQLETRVTKYLLGFWVAQAATTVGLVFGVLKLVH